MTLIIQTVLEMSFTASLITAVIIVLRLVLKKFPKSAVCFLWSFAALRLVCPFSFESSFSLVPGAVAGINSGEYPNTSAIGAIGQNAVSAASSYTSSETVITAVWVLGFFAMLFYGVYCYIKLKRKLSASVKMFDNVYMCDYIDAPFLMGIIKPRIYLPPTLPEQMYESVLLHENSHLKRKDNLWKPLGFLLLSFYWFNPVMWVAYVLFCMDIEFSCDELAVKSMTVDGKKKYSQTLLSCSVKRKTIAVCPIAFGEVGVKTRIKAVLRYRKPTIIMSAFAAGICVVVAVCFMTNPVSSGRQAMYAKQNKTSVSSSAVETEASDTPEVSESVPSVTDAANTQAETEVNTTVSADSQNNGTVTKKSYSAGTYSKTDNNEENQDEPDKSGKESDGEENDDNGLNSPIYSADGFPGENVEPPTNPFNEAFTNHYGTGGTTSNAGIAGEPTFPDIQLF